MKERIMWMYSRDKYVKNTASENTACPISGTTSRNLLVQNSRAVSFISYHGFCKISSFTFLPSFRCTFAGGVSSNATNGPAA